MLAARARVLLIVLWAGSLWTVGYVVAPTLFATLSDRVLAGTIAGAMFRSAAIVSAVCGVLLLLLFAMARGIEPKRRRVLMACVVTMLVCLAISHLGLQPEMSALREGAGPGGVMESAARSRFGMLHGVSAVLYLIQSLLAVVLVLKNPRH